MSSATRPEGRFRWTGETVARALQVPPPAGEHRFGSVSTDTRDLREGDLFVALRGERFDAHDFLADAVAGGAKGLVVERDTELASQAAIFRVPDTLVALGALARFRRRALGWTVVGITGSAGKTTAKELARAALSPSFRVHATEGNRNNRVGLPLTLLDAPEESDVVVAEMGTNEPGEIAILTGIAEPELAVLTTVGEAHLEGLGSREGIMKEKLSLLAGLPEDGWAVVGDVPADLPEQARSVRPDVAVTGTSDEAHGAYRGEDLAMGSDGTFRFRWRGLPVRLRIPGETAVRNALLALAVADRLGVPAGDAVAAVEQVPAAPLRGEVKRIGGLTVVVDCYNANPPSVRASLDLLARMPAPGGRIAVVGSMLELGAGAQELHRRVADDAVRRGFEGVLLVGEEFVRALPSGGGSWPEGSPVRAVTSVEEAGAALRSMLAGDETVLLKASRGLALEALLPDLEEAYGDSGGAAGEGE